MTTARQFRLPHITTILTPLFGIPKGTFGRGIYSPQSLILHRLKLTLDSYAAQVIHPDYLLYRNKALPIHPSVHFAIGYQGEVHQYVNVADVAWGSFDYTMSNFPTPFPEGDFEWLDTYDGVTPDMYSIHIGAASGLLGEDEPMSQAALTQHARLIAYLCRQFGITCNTTNVVMHGSVDLQFAGDCVGDATYPYAAILTAAQTIIANGGEHDFIFDPPPIIEELFGPWVVGISRVGSMAYISPSLIFEVGDSILGGGDSIS